MNTMGDELTRTLPDGVFEGEATPIYDELLAETTAEAEEDDQ